MLRSFTAGQLDYLVDVLVSISGWCLSVHPTVSGDARQGVSRTILMHLSDAMLYIVQTAVQSGSFTFEDHLASGSPLEGPRLFP